MTPPARSSGAAQFELRRFEATPVTGAVFLVELEGRFRQSPRFGRAPVLVIDPGEDRRRIELQPVRTSVEGNRWQASYAVPAEALTAEARLALGVRGTLLELPAPDEPDDGQRLTALAREANALRRQVEIAEADAATARAEAESVTAERAAAVTAARDEAQAAATERTEALELEVNEAHRLAAADAETARAAHAETTARAEAAEQRVAEMTARAEAAEQRATEATARAEAAEQRATELEESLRVAEAAVAAAREQATEEVDAPLTAEMASVIDAEARAAEAERELQVTREGIAVLRSELAEERERSQATIADLEAARSRAEALRNAAAAEGIWPEGPTTIAPPNDATGRGDDPRRNDNGGRSDDEDETRVLHAAFRGEPEPTEAFSVADEADATAEKPAEPLERKGVPAIPARRGEGAQLGRWIAVAALILFAIVLIALLFGL